jgi:hypothetical protein
MVEDDGIALANSSIESRKAMVKCGGRRTWTGVIKAKVASVLNHGMGLDHGRRGR